MSNKTKPTENALIKNPGQGIDSVALAEKLLAENFSQDRTFWIGNGEDKKVPVYFGQLVGPGGTTPIASPGAKIDPVTGEVQTTEIPVWIFNPLDPETFEPQKSHIDSVLCSHVVATACAKYHALAQAAGRPAQILFRWDGYSRTRSGNQINDVAIIGRIVPEPEKNA